MSAALASPFLALRASPSRAERYASVEAVNAGCGSSCAKNRDIVGVPCTFLSPGPENVENPVSVPTGICSGPGFGL